MKNVYKWVKTISRRFSPQNVQHLLRNLRFTTEWPKQKSQFYCFHTSALSRNISLQNYTHRRIVTNITDECTWNKSLCHKLVQPPNTTHKTLLIMSCKSVISVCASKIRHLIAFSTWSQRRDPAPQDTFMKSYFVNTSLLHSSTMTLQPASSSQTSLHLCDATESRSN
jgi:hypothetical protein